MNNIISNETLVGYLKDFCNDENIVTGFSGYQDRKFTAFVLMREGSLTPEDYTDIESIIGTAKERGGLWKNASQTRQAGEKAKFLTVKPESPKTTMSDDEKEAEALRLRNKYLTPAVEETE